MKNPVCFAYAPNRLPSDLRLPGRPELFDILRCHDVTPFLTIGGETALAGQQAQIFQLPGDTVRVAEPIDVAAIALLVNRLDRSIKPERLPGLVIPPMINENAVRRIGYHKDLADREILEPLGYGMPTTVVVTPEDASAFAEAYQYDQYFLKPRHGNFGAGTHKLDRAGLAALFAANPDRLDKMIIQLAYDFSIPFPSSIKPLDRKTTEQFESLNIVGNTKELRMYGFVSPGKTRLFPAARVLRPNLKTGKTESTWFFVDPESIPRQVIGESHDVLQQTARRTGSLALYGAVDFGFGTADDNDFSWTVIELNCLAPGMISREQNVYVATKLQLLFADQIRSTIDELQLLPKHDII